MRLPGTAGGVFTRQRILRATITGERRTGPGTEPSLELCATNGNNKRRSCKLQTSPYDYQEYFFHRAASRRAFLLEFRKTWAESRLEKARTGPQNPLR